MAPRLISVHAPPLVYHPRYSCPWPRTHRFPMWKFKDLYSVLQRQRWFEPALVHKPPPLPASAFTAVHDEAYYRAFVDGGLDADAARRIGFRGEISKPELIERTQLEVAGTVLTAKLALRHGLACNCAGGTHHAHRGHGSGFTILNDLAVAAAWARREGGVRRVAIVDLDVHQGDGTAAIFADEPDVFTFSMHCGKNFPFRKSASDLDVDVPPGTTDGAYLSLLREALPEVRRASRARPPLHPFPPPRSLGAPAPPSHPLIVFVHSRNPPDPSATPRAHQHPRCCAARARSWCCTTPASTCTSATSSAGSASRTRASGSATWRWSTRAWPPACRSPPSSAAATTTTRSRWRGGTRSSCARRRTSGGRGALALGGAARRRRARARRRPVAAAGVAALPLAPRWACHDNTK